MKTLGKSAFSKWSNLLKETRNGSRNGSITIPDRLCRFPYLSELSQSEARHSINLLNQGRTLLRAAVKEPLGYEKAGDKHLTSTRKTRMLQWRFVMAFGGLETMGKALILPRKLSWHKPHFSEFANQMAICLKIDIHHPLDPMPTPGESINGKKRSNLTREKFFNETNLGQGGGMARALNLNRHDVEMLGAWATGQLPLIRWSERLELSKTLRNCTVHGALSANRAYRLGFNHAFRELTKNLETFSESIFAHLVQPNV